MFQNQTLTAVVPSGEIRLEVTERVQKNTKEFEPHIPGHTTKKLKIIINNQINNQINKTHLFKREALKSPFAIVGKSFPSGESTSL
jgi:hypothetical protein